MTVLRYQYPKWPGEWAGEETVINSGVFDFSLEDAVGQVTQAQEKSSHHPNIHWPAQKADNITLLALIAKLEQPDLRDREIVVWRYRTRNWSVQELERERWRWGQALQKWSNANMPAFMESLLDIFNGDVTTDAEEPKEVEMFIPPPTYLPDSLLGENLGWLIYKKKFIQVFCPNCEAVYAPEECSIRQWEESRGRDWDYEGEKILCLRGHTLHGRCTKFIHSLHIQ